MSLHPVGLGFTAQTQVCVAEAGGGAGSGCPTDIGHPGNRYRH